MNRSHFARVAAEILLCYLLFLLSSSSVCAGENLGIILDSPVPGAMVVMEGREFCDDVDCKPLHFGIDLKVNEQDEIRSMVGGYVKKIDYNNKLGHYVVMSTDGFDTYGNQRFFRMVYSHLDEDKITDAVWESKEWGSFLQSGTPVATGAAEDHLDPELFWVHIGIIEPGCTGNDRFCGIHNPSLYVAPKPYHIGSIEHPAPPFTPGSEINIKIIMDNPNLGPIGIPHVLEFVYPNQTITHRVHITEPTTWNVPVVVPDDAETFTATVRLYLGGYQLVQQEIITGEIEQEFDLEAAFRNGSWRIQFDDGGNATSSGIGLRDCEEAPYGDQTEYNLHGLGSFDASDYVSHYVALDVTGDYFYFSYFPQSWTCQPETYSCYDQYDVGLHESVVQFRWRPDPVDESLWQLVLTTHNLCLAVNCACLDGYILFWFGAGGMRFPLEPNVTHTETFTHAPDGYPLPPGSYQYQSSLFFQDPKTPVISMNYVFNGDYTDPSGYTEVFHVETYLYATLISADAAGKLSQVPSDMPRDVNRDSLPERQGWFWPFHHSVGAPGSFADLPVDNLQQNNPNPFNPITVISFSLAKPCYARLEVYNIMGQKVTTLVNGQFEAGEHIVQWDGSEAASGVYLYRLQADDFVETRKMVLLK